MDKKSKFRGVSFHSGNGRFIAKTSARTRKSRSVTIGYFDDEESAARAFDVAACYLRGPMANINFDGSPPKGYTIADIYIHLRCLGLPSHLDLLRKAHPYRANA